MKKKILIITGALLVCGVLAYISFSNSNVSGVNKNAIGETDITKKSYGYPVISLLTYNSNKIIIDAGYFRYGDVNLDAIVDDQDIDEIDVMINSKLSFSKEQKLLADVDESGKVDNNDITLFKSYFKKNGAVNYDLRKDTLEYCLTTSNNSSSCDWKKSNVFNITVKRDYYAFVRQKSTLVKSESSLFKKSEMVDVENKEI